DRELLYQCTVASPTPADSTSDLFSSDTPPTALYTLSLHDALPISPHALPAQPGNEAELQHADDLPAAFGNREKLVGIALDRRERDRKSTRLNSSHRTISYAVFCLKKKKKTYTRNTLDAACYGPEEH